MRSTQLLCLTAILSVAIPLPSQGITLVEGPARTSLDVRVLAESQLGASTMLLQGIEILDIEITGRTVQQPLQTDRSRRIERHGFSRVELPEGGRIFQYRRDGGLHWGYLLIPTSGAATVLLEQPGIGTNSPFADRIAVATDGKHALIPLVANDFFLARLDGGTYPSTGTATRRISTLTPVGPLSPQVGSSFAFFITGEDKIWRVPLVDQGLPVECTPPLTANQILKDELAMSGDGTTVVFLLGSGRLYDIRMLGETGPATTLVATPAEYEECNYLPDADGQAALLLNHDGTRLFYVDETGDGELLMLDTTGVLPTMVITDDLFFEPTIGIHILPSFLGSSLIVAIGRIDLMDWFKVELTQSGGQAVNLTGTGSALTPFPQGSLIPTQVTIVGGKLLTSDAVIGSLNLRQLDPGNANSTLLATDLSAEPIAGSSIHSPPDILVRGAGDRLYGGQSGTMLAATPPPVTLTAPVGNANLKATFVNLGSSGFGTVAIYFDNGTYFTGPLESGVEQLVMTASGSLVIKAATLRSYSMQGSQQVSLPAANVQFIISGAGG